MSFMWGWLTCGKLEMEIGIWEITRKPQANCIPIPNLRNWDLGFWIWDAKFSANPLLYFFLTFFNFFHVSSAHTTRSALLLWLRVGWRLCWSELEMEIGLIIQLTSNSTYTPTQHPSPPSSIHPSLTPHTHHTLPYLIPYPTLPCPALHCHCNISILYTTARKEARRNRSCYIHHRYLI